MEISTFPQALVAGIIFLIMVLVFTILSVMLGHHWNRYETNPERRQWTRKIYYAVSGIILALMLVAFIFILT